ncbi:11361_t:CDS:2, partial [Dentiscutata erythropus]
MKYYCFLSFCIVSIIIWLLPIEVVYEKKQTEKVKFFLEDYWGCDCNDNNCELCQLGNHCTLNEDCAFEGCHGDQSACMPCASDYDCNDGFRCMIEAGVCICKPKNNAWLCWVGDPCVNNKDCETGTCSAGICVPCYNDNECDPGNECLDGF